MGHFFRGIKKKGAVVKFSIVKETMKPEQVINQDPEIHGGVPVFTGTRVPIQALIDHLKAGDSLDYFLEGFPSVSHEQAIAFLEFALTQAIGQTPDKIGNQHACTTLRKFRLAIGQIF